MKKSRYTVAISKIYYKEQRARRKQSTLTVCIIFYLDECFILSSNRCSKRRFTLGASQHQTELFLFFMFCVVNYYQYTRLFYLS